MTTTDTTTETQSAYDAMPTSCPNCEWTGTLGGLAPLDDIHDRVSPGEVMPYGECPECGAACHPDEPESWTEEARRIKAERERDTLRAALSRLMDAPAFHLDGLENEDCEAFEQAQLAMREVPASPEAPSVEQMRAALVKAEEFMRGFEGDELQEGIDDMLAEIRKAAGIEAVFYAKA